MKALQKTISPVDGSVFAERPLAGPAEIDAALNRARAGQRDWAHLPLETRAQLLHRAVDHLVDNGDAIAAEITWQMGRPISQAPGEIKGLEERARYMIDIAGEALQPYRPAPKPGFERYIERRPLGLVAVLAPWDYPYLTAVNAIIPALMAGNAVVLKHAAQTPLAAERFAAAFAYAGLPEGVFDFLHLDHGLAERLVADTRVDFVSFTGSVGGGRRVQAALRGRFIDATLELGGKDPAYVRADADLPQAVAGLVDGTFFNSGQSCCGIERIYVQRPLYRDFVQAFCEQTRRYRLGDPTAPDTTLGPVVNTRAADFVREQIRAAQAAGAEALIDERLFAASAAGTPYLAPQVLINVDHSMELMTAESFGPVIGIQAVASDDEAVALMNDSDFGLTASVWSADLAAARAIGERIDSGTFFMNRCDYLDPALAWSGMKNSGRGCSLSAWGYQALTRPKSYHLQI